MTFDEYIESLPKKVSKVKGIILHTLWGDQKLISSRWVTSSHLLSLTGQKYFDRRIRELRDELGCNIESGIKDGEHCYLLVSTELAVGNLREYLSATQKKSLFEKQHYRCQICGDTFEAGVRGLQADHKMPLVRGGGNSPDNWQSICNECNVAKRRICASCELDCEKCFWAFPDRLGLKISLNIPTELLERLRKTAIKTNSTINDLIKDILDRNLAPR